MNKFIIVASTVFVASLAQAKRPIGPAGCGLGNMIWGKDNQILAATTNGSSNSQTSAITSGTSNCEDSNGVAKLESYIEANPEALASDIARGQGQTLTGLTEVLNCTHPTKVHSLLKDNYKKIYESGNTNATVISNEVRSVLKSNSSVGEGCQG
jgi:hypothetical protein